MHSKVISIEKICIDFKKKKSKSDIVLMPIRWDLETKWIIFVILIGAFGKAV